MSSVPASGALAGSWQAKNKLRTKKGGRIMPVRIVIIDDDQAVLSTVFAIVVKICADDVAVEAFQDPLEAIKNISAIKPNLVITDMIMPGMHGDEVLRWVKEKYSDVPVIIITGYSSDDYAALAHDGVLNKPFKINGLREMLERLGISLK
jgi:DNA-binding NtrC family response regulator